MRVNLKNSSRVDCDGSVGDERCPARFFTFSSASVVRKQARLLGGWNRVPAWQVPDGWNGNKPHDICPDHELIAAQRRADRKRVLEEEREKAKEERRAERKAERDAAREKKQAEREKAKAAKKAERDAAKAAKKAERDAAREKKKAEK